MYDFSLRYSSKTQKLISRKFIRYDPEKVMKDLEKQVGEICLEPQRSDYLKLMNEIRNSEDREKFKEKKILKGGSEEKKVVKDYSERHLRHTEWVKEGRPGIKFQCPECQELIQTPSDLMEHLEEIHSKICTTEDCSTYKSKFPSNSRYFKTAEEGLEYTKRCLEKSVANAPS